MAIQFKTNQNGLYQDPLNGAIIKGDRNNTSTTYKFINDDTFAGDPYGNLYHIPGGSTDVSMPGQTIFEVPANKNKKMNTMQEGGAASQDQQQQIVMQVAQMLQQGADPQEVMKQLVDAGIPAKDAEQLLTSVIQQLQQMMAQQQEQGGPEQQAMMGEEDPQGMMDQQAMMDQQGMAMAEMGGEPCIECFDNYNPSPQAQNLNWYYKAQGGQAFNEQFPQAIPYGRPGQTTPNFMFAQGGATSDQYGGQSDIDRAYEMMKKGGMNHNPKKKKKGKFNHLDEFQKYLKEGGGLKTYAPGGGYDDPNTKYEDPSGQNREIKFNRDYNDYYYVDANGEETYVTPEERDKLDAKYGNNPGVANSNRTPGSPGANNQGAANQGTANQGAGAAGGMDPYGFYNNYLQGQSMGNMLGPKGAAAFSLMQGIFGNSGAGLGAGMMMGRPKFKGKFPGQGDRGLGDRWDFKSKGAAAMAAVPGYFGAMSDMYGNQGAGTTNQGSTSTTNTTNTNNTQGPGGTDPNASGTTPDPNATTNTTGPDAETSAQYRKDWDMSVMNDDTRFDSKRYRNQDRALRHYNRGLSGDLKGKGWQDERQFQEFADPKYSNMIGGSDIFDWRKYNNPERALRHFNEGIDQEGPRYDRGKGWDRTNDEMRVADMYTMQGDPTFSNDLYSNQNRALRHYNQGRDEEDYSGRGWGEKYKRAKRKRNPTFDYGGMTQYKPGGMWNNDYDWKFSYYTPTNPYKTFAVQSGLNSSIDEQNAYDQQYENMKNRTTLNRTPYAQTAGKSINYLGATNARGYDPAYTSQPGNFATDAYMPRLLNNAISRNGGSILDYYEDGAEVDLDGMTPQERDNFIRSVYAAGGSVEFI
jgi:hypothetical protein